MVLCVWFLLVVNTSASDCLERLIPEVIQYVSRGTLNSTHSLTCVLTRPQGQGEAPQGQALELQGKAKNFGLMAKAEA